MLLLQQNKFVPSSLAVDYVIKILIFLPIFVISVGQFSLILQSKSFLTI